MNEKKFPLESIEKIINKFISLDNDALSGLKQIKDKVICIDIDSLPLAIFFKVNEEGYLELFSNIEESADAVIKGGILDLIKASDKNQGNERLFSGRIKIHGDLEIAQHFSKVFGKINIDWEEELSKVIGDFGAVQVSKGIKIAQKELARISVISQKNLSEYLTEEARLLPHRYEFESLQADIEKFRDSVERLSAQVFIKEKEAP
tara:strand:- start:34634 stop:35248 length:615 start_codon:yes stop_codon:yes gene_type:complete